MQNTGDLHAAHPGLEDRRLIYEIIRRMIGKVVNDLITTTRCNLEAAGVGSIDDVRSAGRPLVAMSDEVHEEHQSLKRFLSRHLYRHEKKLAMTRRAQRIVRELFDLYFEDVGEMPAEFSSRAREGDEHLRARVVADYIAGMTDRYAMAEHGKRFGRIER